MVTPIHTQLPVSDDIARNLKWAMFEISRRARAVVHSCRSSFVLGWLTWMGEPAGWLEVCFPMVFIK